MLMPIVKMAERVSTMRIWRDTIVIVDIPTLVITVNLVSNSLCIKQVTGVNLGYMFNS